MSICKKINSNGEETYQYAQPDSDTLYDCVQSLLGTFKMYVGKQDGLTYDDIRCNQPALAEVFVRVDKRKDYFLIYHDETYMNEIKEAALISYWILKFKPFEVVSPDPFLRQKFSQINEAFSVFIIYSSIKEFTKRVNGAKFKISKEYNEKIMYAFKFWDISKEALMLIAESLCESMYTKEK